ncbi:MAG: cytochrome-c oxidase, cbb3-type subunit III [Alphaproteobacteria bacterium]
MPTKIEKDAITGTDTTGHEWDGIKELDTPLPRWWVLTFYVTIVWAVGYWILYPAWPTLHDYTRGILGYSVYDQLGQQMAEASAKQAVYLDRIKGTTLQEIVADKELLDFAQAGGRTAFGDNCAPCHGAGGAGAKGYPNLNDDDWLWGGELDTIYATVRHGIRADDPETRVSDMPRFGADGILTPEQISDVAEYVLSLSGGSIDKEAVQRGAPIFADNCAACHGANGEGNHDLGAPRLNDNIWLYGGDKATVVETITNARRGVMPTWASRLPDSTIKMLVVYVHSLGGGQ